MQQGWTGHTLAGRYLIDDLVGHGGMSSVYRATDSNLKRMVAVKLIHQHLTGDGDFLRRFETEAEAIAQLRHSNIIQVFDFSQHEGQYYMVMEFVAGESLQQRLRRLNESGRKLSTDEIVKIAAGVCDGVEYAHKRGMIHRDIKPANIMLSVQGDAILTDFGLAKIAGTTQHTAAGAVMGTALYMSPEQIRGEQLDGRTDIYALGVTLFEMAGGRPPYTADSAMTVLMMHLNDPLPDIRELNPDVSPGLAAVIEKALAKDPNGRYASAAEMAAALRALSEEPAAAAASPPADEPPADATMIAGAGAGVAAGAGGAPPPAPPQDATAVHRAEPSSAAPGGGAAAPPPPIPPVAERSGEGAGGIPPWVFAVVGAAAVAVIVVVLLVAGVFSGGDDDGGGVVAGSPTGSPTAAATDGASPTDGGAAGTETDAPTAEPTVTDPPGPFARINNITLDGSTYVVDYELFGFTPVQPGMHTHFFFDTVPESEAGSPGSGPWILTYGDGSTPFTDYTTAERPEGATQMCALVAYENDPDHVDHSIEPGSGNCFPLPV